MSCALLLLTGSAVASSGYSFSRANTSFSEFQHDQRSCEHATYSAKLAYQNMADNAPQRGADGQVSWAAGSSYASGGKTQFVACMESKNYHLDPAGFHTGRLWTLQEQ